MLLKPSLDRMPVTDAPIRGLRLTKEPLCGSEQMEPELFPIRAIEIPESQPELHSAECPLTLLKRKEETFCKGI